MFNCWSNNYIEYASNCNRNKKLPIEKDINKVRPYLKDANNLYKFDTQKTKLTIVMKFMSSKDNDEELAMHSKRDNLETMSNDKADEVK